MENMLEPPGRQAEMPEESPSLETYYVVLRETSKPHLDNCITKSKREKQILQKQKSTETYKEVEAG